MKDATMTYQNHGTTLPAFERATYSDDRKTCLNAPDALKWSGESDPPAVGSMIAINFNGLGQARVTGYFSEAGWLGVLCKLLDAPDWHKRQNNYDPTAHVFGAEITNL
jgi:hypothetical protein